MNLGAGSAQEQGEAGELSTLIAMGDPYELQLEHEFAHLEAPRIPARLVRKTLKDGDLSLAFQFEIQDTCLLGLVHELSTSCLAHH